jgi:hypothetical protein
MIPKKPTSDRRSRLFWADRARASARLRRADRLCGTHLAEERKLTAVVAFIPQEFADHTSGQIAIRSATDAQRRALHFLNVGADIDWAHFTDPTYHPIA